MINEKFIARQPIFDNGKRTFAYELLFRNSVKNCYPLDIASEKATKETIYNSFIEIGFDDISSGKIVFINIDEASLHNDLIFSLPKKTVYLELLETIPVTNLNIERISKLKMRGYTLVLDDFDLTKENASLVKYCDIVKIDIQNTPWDKIKRDVSIFKKHKKKILAEKVENHNEFQKCKNLGFDFYQGYFFSIPEMISSKTIQMQKHTIFLAYKSLISEESYSKISSLISKDLGLSKKFLRFANNIIKNSSFDKKYGKIESVHQALSLIGIYETKTFFRLAMIELINDKQSANEIVIISFIRARFLELLFQDNGKAFRDKSYLTGFFSLLDAILQHDLFDIIPKLNLHEEIEDAILYKDGLLGKGLLMLQAIEEHDYDSLKEISNELNVNINTINSIYQQSILWQNEVIKIHA